MFAVPGWNLSAPITTQVEKPKPQDPNKLGKKAQKRAKKQEEQVDEKNIGELWGKVVEGKGADGKEQKKTAERAEQQEDGAQGKRGEKRKRKGNKDAKDDTKGDQRDGVVGEVQATSPAAQKDTAADGESKRNKKKQKKDHKSDGKAQSATTGAKGSTADSSRPAAPVSLLPPEPKGLTPLQKSMRNKLASARFRHLNESLYTKPSKESLELFKEDPSMFEDYHRGFAQQVEVWPENPVDGYVNTVIARGKIRSKDPWKDKKRKDKKGKSAPDADIDSAPIIGRGDAKPLPRNMRGLCTIADLGCGTASLAYRLQSQLKPLNLTINSFDLSKPSGPSAPLVTVADISSLPLPDGSVDVAIFCLALMGTNWLDFIDEAYRVLRWRGELWVSEIKSRFGRVERRKPGQPPINSIGSLKKADKKKGKKKSGEKLEEEEGIQDSGDEAELAERVDGVEGKEGTDVSSFVEILRKHGFILDALPERQDLAIDLSNKMFVKMQFVKSAQPTKGKNAKRDTAASKPGFGNGLKMGMKGKKFTAITDEDAGDDGQDGKVLKPCLYKIR